MATTLEDIMKEATAIQPQTEDQTALIVAEAQANPVALFTDEAKYSDFCKRIRDQVSGKPVDLTTEKGRGAVKALAFKVTKAKTTLDKAGLKLTEEWRRQTAEVTAARKKMVTELDALAAEVRRPLTEWEDAEDARNEEVDLMIANFRAALAVGPEETAAHVEKRGRDLHATELDADLFRDRLDEAKSEKARAVQFLVAAMHRLRKEEADRVELDRLRAEAAERERLDAERRTADEQRQREDAAKQAEAERARVAEERRLADIAAAEDRARQEVQRKADEAARAERVEQQRKHDESLAAEKRQRHAAEREAEEARRKEQERLAWEEKERREIAAREADELHRARIIEEITVDIFPHVMSRAAAHQVATAIAAGTVRHVSARF